MSGFGGDPLQQVIAGEEQPVLGVVQDHQPRSVTRRVDHAQRHVAAFEHLAVRERLGPGDSRRDLVGGRASRHRGLRKRRRDAQPHEVARVGAGVLAEDPAPLGELRRVHWMGEDGHLAPGSLLDVPRPAEVVHVTVRDDYSADVLVPEAEPLEACVERRAPLCHREPRVDHQEAAALLLDDVGVRRSAGVQERDGHGDPMHPELRDGATDLVHRLAFTLASSAGSASKRSATSP